MRPMIHRRRDLNDPAPSRAAYRMTRLWLSPLFRKLVTAVMPAALIVGGGAAWLTQPEQVRTLNTWGLDILSSVEERPEFQIRQMAVTGASPVLSEAIRDRLALEFPVSWFRLDPELLQARVAELDAVAKVQVTVELGGALNVDVTERVPAVIWRRPFSLEMLDSTGHRVAFIDYRDGRPDLPLVTGEGAEKAVPEALMLLQTAAPIHNRLRALTRRGERRWDVMLDRDQIIHLPEDNPRQALERTLAIHAALDLLNRDVSVVDMRDPDRPTVRLGTDAMDYLRLTRTFEQGLARQ